MLYKRSICRGLGFACTFLALSSYGCDKKDKDEFDFNADVHTSHRMLYFLGHEDPPEKWRKVYPEAYKDRTFRSREASDPFDDMKVKFLFVDGESDFQLLAAQEFIDKYLDERKKKSIKENKKEIKDLSIQVVAGDPRYVKYVLGPAVAYDDYQNRVRALKVEKLPSFVERKGKDIIVHELAVKHECKVKEENGGKSKRFC